MIGVIDYKVGNAPSVLNALSKINVAAKLVSHPEELRDLSGLILPGVGSAPAAMASLVELGFVPALEQLVFDQKLPFLGICVGMQVLFEHSEEGNTPCLGWIPGKVKRFPESVRVPQIGWNRLKFRSNHRLTEGIPEPAYFYFVNSFYVEPASDQVTIGTAEYGIDFCALAASDNIYAAQFHIEKSGAVGLAMLKNFAAIVGDAHVD